jgi:hypothetical protein
MCQLLFYFEKKMGWATFWATFLQTYLVTLSEHWLICTWLGKFRNAINDRILLIVEAGARWRKVNQV